jgi:hypothetical protein
VRKNPNPPGTSEGQVHPTASSVVPRHPNINAIRLSIHPEVLPLSHFGKRSLTPLHEFVLQADSGDHKNPAKSSFVFEGLTVS